MYQQGKCVYLKGLVDELIEEKGFFIYNNTPVYLHEQYRTKSR